MDAERVVYECRGLAQCAMWWVVTLGTRGTGVPHSLQR